MKLAFTCNGYYKKSYEEITYTLEIEVEGDSSEYFKELLQKGELTAEHDNNTIVIALRELSWFKHIIFRYVTAINEKHTYNYLAMLEWMTEDDNGIDYYLYKSYCDAKDKYERLIEDENDADTSWVGSEVFDENGEVNEGFEVKCSEETEGEQNLFWKAIDTNSDNRFSIITLTKVETL